MSAVTQDQIVIFAILGVMLVLFVTDRLRYDIVAMLALLAAVLSGVIPADKAFSGFANPVLALIAGALVVSAAVGQSGLVESFVRRVEHLMGSTALQVATLGGSVALLSGVMKNIGALAIFLPVAIQVAERNKRSPSELLMPLGFAALVGGSMTLIGTSPNILISEQRVQLVGAPFQMFDFLPVGAGITVVAIVFLSLGWRLIPRRRRTRVSPEALFRIEDYTTEARIPEGAAIAGKTVAELEQLAEVSVAAIIREQFRRYVPSAHWTVYAGDVLVLEGDSRALKKAVDEAGLELIGSKPLGEAEPTDIEAVGTVEAVVTADSMMIGSSPTQLRLRERHNVNLLAVSRHGRRTTARLRRLKFLAGDVVVLQGSIDRMAETLQLLGCLPLAARNLQLGRRRKTVLPALILAAAIAAASLELVPVAVAFIAAATAIAVAKILSLREIYDSVEWPILVLLGALIPVGEAVQHTGATDLIAGWLSIATRALPGFAVLGVVMATTMLVTPILHHAAAVIVMGPVAATLAKALGYNIDPFLMAVAIGANSDFLSPIGHQCNTLVMGPGGYRFGDYWRLGLPLSALVILTGVPLILTFWPLR